MRLGVGELSSTFKEAWSCRPLSTSPPSVGGAWQALRMPAPTASSITVVETLALLDNKFQSVADAVETSTYALWLGSGISKEQVADLSGVVKRVLAFLQSNIDPANPACPFRKGLDAAIELGDLTPVERASIDVNSPTHLWPLLESLTGKLTSNYSDLLDIRVEGRPDDFLLWDAVDVRVTYPPSANPDCEHLCVAILAIEGIVPTVASANWDGLLESAVRELAENPDDIMQVIVRAIDFRADPARSELLKFHGCAVLAGKDEAEYRKLLIARKAQITAWMQNPDFEVMRDHLKQLAITKPALVLGLSIQDINIQQIFAQAQFTMPWAWPSSPPAAVFSGSSLAPGHVDILKQVYPQTYTANQASIADQSLIPAYAKQLLVALTTRMLCGKLAQLARMIDGVSLPETEWTHLLAGLTTLRDALVENAHIDYLGFVRRFALDAGEAVYRFQRGQSAPTPHYRPLTAHPRNRLTSEPALITSGAPEVASALAVIGLGQQRGLWSVNIGPTVAGSNGSIRIDSASGVAAVFFAANGPAEIQLGISGLMDTLASDAIVVQSTDAMPATSRSPRGAPGRTGSVGARRIAMRDIMWGANSADGLLADFRMAVGL